MPPIDITELLELELELIHVGFYQHSTNADITPTALSLQLNLRSQGYIGFPIDYFGFENEEFGNAHPGSAQQG